MTSSAGAAAFEGRGPARAPDGCPPPAENGDPDPAFDQPYADLPAAVPDRALAARVCAGGGITSQVPADTLTTSVDALADAAPASPRTSWPRSSTSSPAPSRGSASSHAATSLDGARGRRDDVVGDRMVIHADCADFRLPTGEVWVPSPEVRGIRDDLVSEARPVR